MLKLFTQFHVAISLLGIVKNLAPTQTEAPFKIAQGVALLAFIGIGVKAVFALN